MLKFRDKNGKLVLVWFDDEEAPAKVEDLTEEQKMKLKRTGVVLKEIEPNKKRLLDGPSTDDIKFLK